mmetsp:Transcript_16375/g.38775  ORF Transcript_16375/g.38775 Transcript_16375/m.38775 type:complete len:746 (-) Transcript_16375:25-2262(-)
MQRLLLFALVASAGGTTLRTPSNATETPRLRATLLEKQAPVPAAAAPPPTAAPGPSPADVWRVFRQVLGYTVLAFGIALWAYWMPALLYSEHEKFLSENLEGRTFNMYLTYRFNYWMNSQGLAAMTTILGIGVLSLLTAGALLYSAFVGGSPVTGLWVCFVWASAASVEPNASAITGFVGILTTLGGLVLLAVLLTTISDYFAKQVEASKQGRDPVVEGGHLLLLGHSVQTKQLLEEFAACEADDKPTTVVILASQSKQEVEDDIAALNTDVGDLKLVVRSGKCCDKTDLWKVGADCAKRIVIPENPNMSQDESDAAAMGILLTLKGQGSAGWPTNGYVAVSCCLGRNVTYLNELYDKTFILSGERLGRIMVQSVQDQGLCSVFNQLIGFSGDEFYVAPAEELGVVGKTFHELPFWFPITVPLGVVRNGEYFINPDKSFEVNQDDAVILLADDDDAVQPVDKEAYFDYSRWAQQRKAAEFAEANPNDGETVKVLICNLNERNFGCAILFALDEMMGPGSEVDIYCSLGEEEVQEILSNAQRRQDKHFENISVSKIYFTPANALTSMYRLKELPLETYDHIFLLADASQGVDRADEQTVAMVLQMKSLVSEREPEKDFQPMIEICTPTAEEQLSQVGIQNMINTTLLVSKALAMVAISDTNHGVLSDLLSADGNNMDIMDLADYLAEGETLPKMLTFAEATAIVGRAAQQVLIGWSEDGEFVVNPKSKLDPRPWTSDDRLVVIKDV